MMPSHHFIMFKLNNCRWRMALAAIVALSIGFSSQAAEIDQIGTPESKAILTVGQVVKSASGIECIKKNKMQTGLQTKLTSKIEDTLKEEEERADKLLASIIYCEAGNQSFTGQVAVGAVVLNRMANEAYPDTMEEVIYQPGQFCPAGSGWLDRVRSTDGYTESAMQAAEAALAGENPIGDCLYFDQGGYGYQIGAHYFH